MAINMSQETFKKVRLTLMALLFVSALILFMLALRPQATETGTAPSVSMSVLGSLMPVQANSAPDTDTGDACHQGNAGPEVVEFCEQYFQLNHPEVLK